MKKKKSKKNVWIMVKLEKKKERKWKVGKGEGGSSVGGNQPFGFLTEVTVRGGGEQKKGRKKKKGKKRIKKEMKNVIFFLLMFTLDLLVFY